MSDRCLHAHDLQLGFGIYCRVAENIEPSNSFAPRKRAAVSLGNSGNLSGGQLFLALGSGKTIVTHQWVVLPVLPAEIDCVNLLGKHEPSIFICTNWHDQDISDLPQDFEPHADKDDIFLWVACPITITYNVALSVYCHKNFCFYSFPFFSLDF
jgi:hypothetical protein